MKNRLLEGAYRVWFLSVFFVSGCVATNAPTDGQPSIDVRISGGLVYDGSAADGSSEWVVDVVADRIVYVGPSRPAIVSETIDASGLIVAPGFIDPHTHTFLDLADAKRAANLAYVYQGVTTVFIGNDGGDGRFAEIENA